MLWFHRGVLHPFRRSWHTRCHTWNAKVPKGSLLVCQGAMFMWGRLLTLKREPEWGCDACWLLAAIMPGSATHVASGSGQVSKKVRLWLAADSCLKTTGHMSQVPWFTSVMAATGDICEDVTIMGQVWSSLCVLCIVPFPPEERIILGDVTMPLSFCRMSRQHFWGLSAG